MRRPLFVASLSLALVIALGGGWILSEGPEDEYRLDTTPGSIALNKVSEGRILASVELLDDDANRVATNTWLGTPLVVNFWFSTCEPCRREFPVLVAADAKFDHIRFIGVNISDTTESARSFLARYNATFDNFFDRDGTLTSAMNVATAPVTLLIDAGGVVRRQLTGEVTAETLSLAIVEVFPT